MKPELQSGLRVSFLCSYPPLKGISSYCFELVQAISQTRPVDVISFKSMYPSAFYPGGKNQKDKTFPHSEGERVRVFRHITWFNPLTWIHAGLTLKGNILHVQWWSLPLLPVFMVVMVIAKFKKMTVITTVHNVNAHEPSIIFKVASKIIFSLSDGIIVHTKQNQSILLNTYKVKRSDTSVIPHGPLEFFKNSNPSKTINDFAPNIPKDIPVMLLFGAIRPYKGVDTAIQAMGLLKDKGVQCHLVIAGQAWGSFQPYSDLIEPLGITDRISTSLSYIETENVSLFFDTADLVLLPYHQFESQSGVGSVGTAFGKPMVVSNCGGLPELVDDHQCVFPPGNAPALADCLEAIINNPGKLKQMQQKSSISAQKMSWQTIAKKTNGLYSSFS